MTQSTQNKHKKALKLMLQYSKQKENFQSDPNKQCKLCSEQQGEESNEKRNDHPTKANTQKDQENLAQSTREWDNNKKDLISK